jgi:hypothetical protein
MPLKCSKGDGDRNCHIEIKFRWENTESFGHEPLEHDSSGHNSPWRAREVARTIRSSGDVRCLGVGRTHHPSIKNQRKPLIVVNMSH